MRRWITAIGVSTSIVAGAAHPASAQIGSPREVSGGYVYVNDSNNQVALPAGWMAGGSLRVTDWLSAVAEGGVSTRTTTTFGSDIRLKIGAVLGGGRAQARLGRLTEFGQLVVGVVRGSASGFGVTNTNTAVGIQPGAGLDYPLTARLAGRAQVDVRLIRGGSSGTTPGHEVRLLAGLAFKLR